MTGAVITQGHQLSVLHRRNVFSAHPGGWRSEMEMWTGLVSPEASPCCVDSCPLLLPHVILPLCMSVSVP